MCHHLFVGVLLESTCIYLSLKRQSLFLPPVPLLPHTPAHISSAGCANHRLSLCHPHTHACTCMLTHTNTVSPSFSIHFPLLLFYSPALLSCIYPMEDVSTYSLSDSYGFLAFKGNAVVVRQRISRMF